VSSRLDTGRTGIGAQESAAGLAARLAVLILVAGLLRLLLLDQEGFWYDEIVAHNLTKFSWGELLTGQAKDGGNPQGFWLIGKAWVGFFGDAEARLRLLSALLGIAAPLALYAFGRRLLSDQIAFTAALLLAVNPNHIYMSQEFRPYTAAILACTGVLLCALRFWSTGSKYALAGYVLCCVLGLYLFYYTALPMIGLFAWSVLTQRKDKIFWQWFLAHVAVTALYIPGLLVFAEQMLYRSRSVGEGVNASWLHFAASPLTLLFGRALVWREDGLIVFAAVLACCYLYFLGLAFVLYRRGQPPPKWLYIACVGTPVFVLVLAVIARNMQAWDDRKALFILLPVLILMVHALFQLSARWRAVWLALLLAVSIGTNVKYFVQQNRDDWRGVSKVIEQQMRDQDLIGVIHSDELEGLAYYLRKPSTATAKGVYLFGFDPQRKAVVDVHPRESLPVSKRGMLDESSAQLTPAPGARVWLVVVHRRTGDALKQANLLRLIEGKARMFEQRFGASITVYMYQ
jgi:4-amino-4-deoxy-L-arabinose transferase-like glycosyltransferase